MKQTDFDGCDENNSVGMMMISLCATFEQRTELDARRDLLSPKAFV